MSDLLRCSDLEGRRVFRARRPSRRLRADNQAENVPEGEEVVEEVSYDKVGKVRACLFHPTKARFVGLLVRRPDLLLMFHRKDAFLPRGGFELEDKRVYIESGSAVDAKPAARIDDGQRLSDCVIWTGLDIVTESGERLGYVGNVTFDAESGAIESLSISEGSTSTALLGAKVVPAEMIRGFQRGIGSDLVDDKGRTNAGAILVADEAASQKNEGGLADSAGKAWAVTAHKASEAVKTVKPIAAEKATAFKQKYIDVDDEPVDEATEDARTDSAFESGAQAVGRQLKRAKGMFGDFMDEYRKARDE